MILAATGRGPYPTILTRDNMIQNVLQLDDVDVMHVSRLPKPDSGERKRLVMVKLASREQRNKVLKNKAKLKR